jgi:hypothetical protein
VCLRERLLNITLNEVVAEHPAMLEALRAEIPHTVAVKRSDYPLDRYTCAVHAFSLVEDPTYESVAGFGYVGYSPVRTSCTSFSSRTS